ncbi:amino acid permease [Sphingobacterium spiritivorum]|uniref:Amino acid permease n=1 Tax=Sphingobacterium spiritivorum ATCC 33861 TaxID=525373 RepID=D7VMU9_SPHSI|nr:amino acid permease [Sphingobacterium spiritivorum]EFK57246.1 amino acid permease [Sphingobacterium spiritivorum ATCC 33861]QQT36667.1 amino acid permease [Sphingobacterium spiritivorum]WQD33419.1 amino acid permease [Sphingobacterium spiritivorum]SUJ23288.1 Putrescine importer PuuP [Sphingobacterium spiritivorum]
MGNQLFRKKSIDQIISDSEHGGSGLSKILGVRDLVSLGIAAIVGAGIFSTIGLASFNGGPAVSLLFVFVAFACVFTALSYAQFASTVPVSGSAYTYAYVAFGELFAWIIGWALVLEYAVSNMVVAISWSQYFVSMLEGFGIHVPRWLSMAPAYAIEANQKMLEVGVDKLTGIDKLALEAYVTAPRIGNVPIIFDLPAGVITFLVTILVYVGIKESKRASNIMVMIKVGIILAVIFGGLFFVKPDNWTPFAPNGLGGVMSSVAAVFFAFIGFDSISTTAEECKNPQRDLPRAMIYCLLICTVLYVAIALVLTGMVNYTELNVKDPLAYVFQYVGFDHMAGIISVTSVIAITSALLVYQLAQPRIWMTMSRDGLLWKKFATIHPKYKTPSYATVVTGIVVAVPSLFFKMDFFVDLTSVGTFFAFILVCAGVLYMDHSGLSKKSKFRVPYVNGKYLVGLGFLIAMVLLFVYGQDTITEWKSMSALYILEHKSLVIIFWLVWIGMSFYAFRLNFSLLPTTGILINLYLMTELGASNWIIFILWLLAGLIIYFMYGYRHSRLNKEAKAIAE